MGYKVILGGVLVALVIGVFGCRDSVLEGLPPCPTIDDTEPRLDILPTWQRLVGRSLSGRKVAFTLGESGNQLQILDVPTGEIERIHFWEFLPDGYDSWDIIRVMWCPYDEKRFLVFFTSYYIDNDGALLSRDNYYVFSLSERTLTRVLPSFLLRSGDADSAGIKQSAGFSIERWLLDSRPGKDCFEVFYEREGRKELYYQYCWQQDSLVAPISGCEYIEIAQRARTISKESSPDGRYCFIFWYGETADEIAYYLGDWKLPLDPKIRVDKASWSLDGKRLALAINMAKGPAIKDQQIWVFDNIDSLLALRPPTIQPDHIARLEDHCMATFDFRPEFLTDTSFVIALFPPYVYTLYLYEISISGLLLRQLTFQLDR